MLAGAGELLGDGPLEEGVAGAGFAVSLAGSLVADESLEPEASEALELDELSLEGVSLVGTVEREPFERLSVL